MKHFTIDTEPFQKSEFDLFHDGGIERLMPLEAENRALAARIVSQSSFSRRFPIIERHLGGAL